MRRIGVTDWPRQIPHAQQQVVRCDPVKRRELMRTSDEIPGNVENYEAMTNFLSHRIQQPRHGLEAKKVDPPLRVTCQATALGSVHARFATILSLVLIASAVAKANADEPLVFAIWPGAVPDEVGGIGAEYVRMSPKLERRQTEVTESTKMITNVTKPTITIRRPPRDSDAGTAMLIFRGGGYWNLYWEVEGEEVADWLNSQGMTAVLRTKP